MQKKSSAPTRPAQPFDVAAFRREIKEERRCEREAAFLDGHLDYVECALKHIYGWKASVDRNAIRDVITPLLPPRHVASRERAAVHECGHIVGFESQGLNASGARLSGSPGDPLGWSGEASCGGDLYLEPGRWSHDPENFYRKARIVLAGPIAEEIVAGGHALFRVGELMGARVYSDHGAALTPEFSGAAWIENVCKAIAMVERYRWQISELAEMLARRKEIRRSSPSVYEVLKTITLRARIATDDLSPKGDALARRIIAETPHVTGFVITKESAQ